MFDFVQYFKHDPSVPDSEVTHGYCARHNWLVGSPETVAAKLHETYEAVGGSGTLLIVSLDYSDEPEAWHTSLRLLAEEVRPRFSDLTPAEPAVGAACGADPQDARALPVRPSEPTGRHADL